VSMSLRIVLNSRRCSSCSETLGINRCCQQSIHLLWRPTIAPHLSTVIWAWRTFWK
jgi:hypothetical protein